MLVDFPPCLSPFTHCCHRIPGWKGPQGSSGPSFLELPSLAKLAQPLSSCTLSAWSWGLHHCPGDIILMAHCAAWQTFFTMSPGVTSAPVMVATLLEAAGDGVPREQPLGWAEEVSQWLTSAAQSLPRAGTRKLLSMGFSLRLLAAPTQGSGCLALGKPLASEKINWVQNCFPVVRNEQRPRQRDSDQTPPWSTCFCYALAYSQPQGSSRVSPWARYSKVYILTRHACYR